MKKVLIVLGILGLLFVGYLALKMFGVIGSGDKGTLVETMEVERSTIVQTVSATGKIKPEIEVSISPEVPGEIIELPVVEGQAVSKGQLLARINPDLLESSVSRTRAGLSSARSNYAQTQASLAEARVNFDRIKRLYDKGVVSKADYDAALANFDRAKASERAAYYSVQSSAATVNEANDNLGRTSIFAPMSGTISLLAVELGERVVGTQQMAGTELLRVADLSQMEVEVDVNENDIVKINVGDKALVEVDAYGTRQFEGEVTEIANTASQALSADQVTNFKVKVRILSDSYVDLVGDKENYSPFRPGMTAVVDIITDEAIDVVAVPISSIVVKTDTTGSVRRSQITADSEKFECVFINENGKSVLKVVETGIQDDRNIVIRSGVQLGDEVITGPYRTVTDVLKPGKDIRVKGDSRDEEDTTTE